MKDNTKKQKILSNYRVALLLNFFETFTLNRNRDYIVSGQKDIWNYRVASAYTEKSN